MSSSLDPKDTISTIILLCSNHAAYSLLNSATLTSKHKLKIKTFSSQKIYFSIITNVFSCFLPMIPNLKIGSGLLSQEKLYKILWTTINLCFLLTLTSNMTSLMTVNR